FQKYNSLDAPITENRSLKTPPRSRSPSYVFTAIGKKQRKAATTILETRPCPNQSATKGAIATTGIPFEHMTYGRKMLSAHRLIAIQEPRASPIPHPRTAPNADSSAVTPAFLISSPKWPTISVSTADSDGKMYCGMSKYLVATSQMAHATI